MSLQKEQYGLGDVDFETLSVGEKISAYEYLEDKLCEMDFQLYPLLSDGNIVAFVDEFWARFKVIEDTEDIKEICKILNSIDAKKMNGTGTEDIPQGGPALTFIFERSSGPSIEYGYYAGIFLTRDGVRYRIEDGRLGVVWETKSGSMEGTYRVEFDEE